MKWRIGKRRTELMDAKLAIAARDMRQSCDHECVSCDYFDRVYEITASDFLRLDTASLKRHHTSACFRGEPISNSCVEAQRFKSPE